MTAFPYDLYDEVGSAARAGELYLFGCGLRIRRAWAGTHRRRSAEETAIVEAFEPFPDELSDGYGDCEEEEPDEQL